MRKEGIRNRLTLKIIYKENKQLQQIKLMRSFEKISNLKSL